MTTPSNSLAPARPAASLPPVRCNAGAFVDHLLAVHESGQSGVMSVHTEDSVTDVYLRRGTPVFAQRNTLAGSLGRSLLRDGTLTAEQYERVVAEMTKTVFDSEDICLAEVLVQLGYMDHQSVNERLEEQVRSTVMDCMRWTEPQIRFLAGGEASLVLSYPCPVPPLVLSGVKKHYDVQRTEDVWRPNADAYAELARSPAETGKIYGLKPEELRYVSRIDGARNVESLVYGAELDVLHAGQITAALLLTDGVRLFANPAETGIESLRPLPSVPVISDATRRRMSSPLLHAVRQPASTAISPPVAPIQIRAQPAPRARPMDRVRAEKVFLHGKRFLASRMLGKAVQAFERATELDATCPEYSLHAEWCRFIKEPPLDSATALDRLRSLAEKTIEADPRAAFAHYVHGRVALSRGEHELARRSLRMAARLDPKNEDARRFLRSLSKK